MGDSSGGRCRSDKSDGVVTAVLNHLVTSCQSDCSDTTPLQQTARALASTSRQHRRDALGAVRHLALHRHHPSSHHHAKPRSSSSNNSHWQLPWGLLATADAAHSVTLRADQLSDWLAGPAEVLQQLSPRIQAVHLLGCKDTVLLQELLATFISRLPNLKQLHLSGCLTLTWDSDAAEPLQHSPTALQQLLLLDDACRLSDTGVTWLLSQPCLTSLRVCGAEGWVGGATQLQSLDLSSCRTVHRHIPQSVSSLTSLQTLCARNLRLPELPEGLTQLQQLAHLDLQGHRVGLEQLWILGELQQLTYVDISGRGDRQLGALPCCLEQLPQLRVLKAAQQGLKGVPLQLPDLEQLDLSCNCIKPKHGQGLGHLTSLRVLSLAGCSLQHLDGLQLEVLSHLQHLRLAVNRLKSLSGLGPLPQLQHLDLSRNRLATLRLLPRVGALDQLTCLKLGHNPLKDPGVLLRSDGAAGQRLVHLDLSNLGLTNLQPWAAWMCNQAQQLRQLVVRDNPVSGLVGLEGLPRQLTYLDCSSCDLSEVPSALARLTDLRELVIQDNSLEQLPMWLSQLRQLEVLDVWRCRLPSPHASKVLGHMLSLKQIRRDKSTLYHLPNSLKHLDSSDGKAFTR